MRPLKISVLGLSITSSWGNGHATTFRSLIKGLAQRGHSVTFLERDVPWYADNRDLPSPPYTSVRLYQEFEELESFHRELVRSADLVIVGSYVPDGIAVGDWVARTARGVTAFYDIDTPVTLSKLRDQSCEYLAPRQISRFDLYLSFTGGPTLQVLEREFASPRACPLYCSVDPEEYFPLESVPSYDLGYLGTYSTDRQPALKRLLLDPAASWPAGRFAVAGPQYPDSICWPDNVDRIDHLPPHEHGAFYNNQRFTLNVTRADMVRAGYSPSVRLFEAAACGTPIISDWWSGLDSLFRPGREILIARSGEDTRDILRNFADTKRRQLSAAARRKILNEHTSVQRAGQLEQYFHQAFAAKTAGRHLSSAAQAR